jgi:hypothetical protein
MVLGEFEVEDFEGFTRGSTWGWGGGGSFSVFKGVLCVIVGGFVSGLVVGLP